MDKLKKDQELIFSQGTLIMEKVTVESIDKQNGFVILSNKVKVSRTPGPDGSYYRIDGKPSKVVPVTKESQKELDSFNAYFSLKRNLDTLRNKVDKMKIIEDSDNIILISNKISKILNRL